MDRPRGRAGGDRRGHGGGLLIHGWLQTVAQWPPAAIYTVIAMGTVLENIVPPVPADVAVVLAAFLVHTNGVMSPELVFLTGWGGSVAGAVIVHLAARRFGRPFLGSRAGRLLVQPDALAFMERSYLRFGMAGLFAGRILPGFRSIVAPFTGLVCLPIVRSMVPIALASAVWYGMLTWIGASLGANWELIGRVLSGLNTTLAVLAGLLLVAAVLAIRASRRQRRRVRLWEAFHRAFSSDPAAEAKAHSDPAYAAIGILIYELVRSHEGLTPDEHQAAANYLREHWHLPDVADEPRPAIDPATFARILGLQYPRPARAGLLQRLARLGETAPSRDRILERAALLLDLGEEELDAARTGGRGEAGEGKR